VLRSIEEIGIAERDVFPPAPINWSTSAISDLLLHHAELTVIDRDDRAMAAHVLASPCSLSVYPTLRLFHRTA